MKKLLKQEIFSKLFDGELYDVRFSDLPKDIQDNDIIEIRREEGYHSENNSYGAYTELVVIREVEETDEEYQKRIENENRDAKIRKAHRYEQYLKLKKEFESETASIPPPPPPPPSRLLKEGKEPPKPKNIIL